MDSITERFLMQNGYSFRKTVHRLDQREIPCRRLQYRGNERG